MALLVDSERVGDIVALTCMGNEGVQWIGMAPFVDRDHFIQNLGDGTYFHSGQLAITAAIAAGVNITYKLLFNGAIAMTGGQDPQGRLPLRDVVSILRHQGVAEVLVTTDDPARTRAEGLPEGTKVWDRSRLLEAQEYLATVPGVTVLIHDQRCAAELRRDRKRGRADTPTFRVVINERVCEGCGDCGQISNCLSVEPVDTRWGRKTRIDQTTCNFDLSCLEGDCPSFALVEGSPSRWQRWWARRFQSPRSPIARPELAATGDLPPPRTLDLGDDISLRIAGVGGTGVVTVAQVLGTAATLDGATVRGLDQTGLSQKAGPVVSDIRITWDHALAANRLGKGQADLLLAFDQLVAVTPGCLDTCLRGHTVVVGSTSRTPTGAMITHPDLEPPPPEELAARIAEVSDPERQHWIDADAVSTAVFGNTVTSNMVVAGMAVQVGAIPIDPARIEEAIRLNGVAVEANIEAFRLGRRLIVEPTLLEDLGIGRRGTDETTEELVERLAADLVAYQDEAYATEFRRFVDEVAAAEDRVAGDSERLTRTVAVNLHKLMAYKDEYEVARLLLDPEGRRPIEQVRTDDAVVIYRLHPPVLRALGVGRKMSFGPWSEPLFRRLAAAKGLRRRRWDPFGWPKVRREERKLAAEYRKAIRELLPRLSAQNLPAAVEIAELPDLVRGYEDLKLERIAAFRSRLRDLTAGFGS
jgi:indolepyruvate ferredoxin oxidoreductase